MRSIRLLAAVVLATCLISSAQAEESYFDLETCSICKNLGAHPELLSAMKWEIHEIENGMLEIVTLPDEMKKTMDQCHAAMMKVVDKLKAGEPATLCQFCQSYGGLEMSGAKTQEIKSAAGYITLVTSDNPEVVKKIHAHAKKTKTEYEKMLAATGK